MIKDYNTYINENTYKDYFLILYNKAPQELKNLVDKTKEIEQNPFWHSEGNVYIHTRLVTNRLYNCYNNINLNLSGFFHDLGKIDKTKFDEDKQSYTAYEHELASVDIVERFRYWIKDMGGNVDKVKYIVANHMRIKFLSEMRINEQINFMNNPYFDDVQKFSTADYGGKGLECKPIPDNKEIIDKINKKIEKEKEDKIISSKFNGRIIMDKYPELKGKELGDAIGDFKSKYDDFRTFALNTTSEEILMEFDDYYQSIIKQK